jgi:proline iminopeptidase
MVAVNGTRLWTAVQGEGTPIVLCHGGPGLPDNLAPVADMLSDLALTIRYDQRGCGRSASDEPYSLTTYLEDLDGLRRHFGIGRWTVGGHSFGSCLALAYAVERPAETTALVYLTPPFVDPDFMDAWAVAEAARLSPYHTEIDQLVSVQLRGSPIEAAAAHRRMLGLYFRSKFFDPARAISTSESTDHPPMNTAVNSALQRDWIAYVCNPDNRQRIAQLDRPALLCEPEADRIPIHSDRNLACLSTRTEHNLLERTGHFPWVESPDALRKVLRGFVQRHTG